MALGFKGKDIGIMNAKIFAAILGGKLKNNKNDIINFIQQKPEEGVMQEVAKKKTTKLTFFDFDGTLANSPTPENGREKYKETTGKEYPHIGWWGKEDSLKPFDIKFFPSTIEFYKKSKANPNNKTILLTNRIPKLEEVVKEKLAKANLTFDDYSFKEGKESKVERIESYLHRYPDVTEIEIHDDQEDQLTPFSEWADKKEGLNIIIYDAKEHIINKN